MDPEANVMIQQGWGEHYNRMGRSHARLVAIANSDIELGSDDARDALFHFFQDAYQLKDWLKNDPNRGSATKQDIENAVDGRFD